MPKMVCIPCQTEYKILKTGAYLVEMAGHIGETFENDWVYKVWSADVWECPGCNQKTVAGFSNNPLMEHFHNNFDKNFRELLEKADEGKIMLLFSYERPNPIGKEAMHNETKSAEERQKISENDDKYGKD